MNSVHLEEIKTNLNSFEIYKLFYQEKYSFFLDSSMSSKELGRYSFIGFNPFLTIKSKGEQIKLVENNKENILMGNPFKILKNIINRYYIKNETGLPFIGGAVGYFAYDLCHHIEKLPTKAYDDLDVPEMIIGFYDGIVVIDHVENKKYAVSAGLPYFDKEFAEKKVNKIKKRVEEGQSIDYSYLNEYYEKNKVDLISNFTFEDYCRAIEKAKEYIRRGDIFQVNLTQRFNTLINKHPINIYEKLRIINAAPFASYMEFDDISILCSSPERFIQLRNNVIETRPIKGTMPRGRTQKEDIKNRKILKNSIKDKAENVMIVDLMRNDIGKICKFGTVNVPELLSIEEYATVFHLVSTVTGELLEAINAVDCLEATFPGGSITGAPKIRAMEIIDEIETTQRSVYTGSIGYIGFEGDMDINIVIRTILIKGNRAYYQVGGGIVWDSIAENEFEETLNKGLALKNALL